MVKESFRVFWAGPYEDEISTDVAPGWTAHITTRGGAGEVTYGFKDESNGTGYAGMYGTVDLHGESDHQGQGTLRRTGVG